MADEVKITAMTLQEWRGNTVIYSHANIAGQTIDSAATQDNSTALPAGTEMVSIANTGTGCNVVVWDSAGTVTAANSQYIGANERLDILARPGQIVSTKQV